VQRDSARNNSNMLTKPAVYALPQRGCNIEWCLVETSSVGVGKKSKPEVIQFVWWKFIWTCMLTGKWRVLATGCSTTYPSAVTWELLCWRFEVVPLKLLQLLLRSQPDHTALRSLLALLLRFREIPGSNPDPAISYPDCDYSWFSSVPPDKCRDDVSN
jgi:hypothetical protein